MDNFEHCKIFTYYLVKKHTFQRRFVISTKGEITRGNQQRLVINIVEILVRFLPSVEM